MMTRSMPVCSAASNAIGKMSAAAALLVTTLLIKNVAKYTAASNPASPIPTASPTLTKKLATPPATPEFTKAVPMPNALAIVMYTSQFTASRASCSDNMPSITMTIDATSAQMSSDATPAVKIVSMAAVITSAGINSASLGGAESSTSASSAKDLSLSTLLLMNVGPASSSSTSPACSLMRPGCSCTRLPSRCTAITAAPYFVRNRTSFTLFPTNGPRRATTASTRRRSCTFSLIFSTSSLSYDINPGIFRKSPTADADPENQRTSPTCNGVSGAIVMNVASMFATEAVSLSRPPALASDGVVMTVTFCFLISAWGFPVGRSILTKNTPGSLSRPISATVLLASLECGATSIAVRNSRVAPPLPPPSLSPFCAGRYT
mmetsp:Transcript_18082/g.51384  ORF Transcript_18082/g.51384 Transcript_18082/m.51384 type:complete len:377 (-) Transcript_18082:2763-3893(-)